MSSNDLFGWLLIGAVTVIYVKAQRGVPSVKTLPNKLNVQDAVDLGRWRDDGEPRLYFKEGNAAAIEYEPVF